MLTRDNKAVLSAFKVGGTHGTGKPFLGLLSNVLPVHGQDSGWNAGSSSTTC